jgi:mannose-6-phosphate isomerase-like protein (cupin superfamily)
MKNRRNFLQAAAIGLLAPMVSLPKLAIANELNNHGIVMQPGDGETYFVRENTPITIKVSKRTDDIDSVSICTEEIPSGGGIPIHKHLNNDELFFFHKGKGTFILDEKEIQVEEGSTAFVPKGTWHGLKNTGSELLIFTFGFSPAGFEDFFRQIGTLKGTPFKAKTKEEIKVLAKKYGMLYK